MRTALAFAILAALAIAGLRAAPPPQARLSPEPMRIEKVKENLYVIRGPFARLEESTHV